VIVGSFRLSATGRKIPSFELHRDRQGRSRCKGAYFLQTLALILEKTGRLDALINNAGFSICGAVEDVSMAEAKAIFETNFFGALRVSRAATAALRDSRGVLINMSSVAGQIGPPSTPIIATLRRARRYCRAARLQDRDRRGAPDL
jgi:NAD(P)-dependent dehydrogenase (short-subunit alcohol dehydrogenase family)